MSEQSVNPRKLFFDFWQELNFDPYKAEIIEAFLTGQRPYLPSDPELRRRYLVAANRVLTAPEAERDLMTKAVAEVRAISYTDQDFSEADFA